MVSFRELRDVLMPPIITRIEQHQGLANFASIRAKFEGWLKVELCEILAQDFPDVLPEQDRIDLSFQDWVIELKTINTNYRYNNVKSLHRPITKNVSGLVKDVKKLRNVSNKQKAVCFVVFPVDINNETWKTHEALIENELKNLDYSEFTFKNNIPGLIYMGEV